MLKKIIAFTMAEVLVVIGLLGVVGALTVPNLKKSYESKANAAKARAAFMKLDSALRQVDLNAVLNGKTTYEARSLAVYNAMKDYLKLTVSCGTISDSNYCFTKNSITDSIGFSNCYLNPIMDKNDCSSGILNDGTEFAICISSQYGDENVRGINNAAGRGAIYIDVDGANKGSTTRGQDIYVFGVGEEGLFLINRGSEVAPEEALFAE